MMNILRMIGMVEEGPGSLGFRCLRRVAEEVSEVENTGCPDLLAVRTEVAVSLEAPVQGTGDPVLQSPNIEPGLSVDLLVPEVRDSLVVGESTLAHSRFPLRT